MVNRTLVRTKVVQTLFAYYKDGEKTPLTARKELLKSFSDTYSLYMMLLAFACELTDYAAEQIREAKTRAAVTHTHYEPNYRFVNNRIAQQLFICIPVEPAVQIVMHRIIIQINTALQTFSLHVRQFLIPHDRHIIRLVNAKILIQILYLL